MTLLSAIMRKNALQSDCAYLPQVNPIWDRLLRACPSWVQVRNHRQNRPWEGGNSHLNPRHSLLELNQLFVSNLAKQLKDVRALAIRGDRKNNDDGTNNVGDRFDGSRFIRDPNRIFTLHRDLADIMYDAHNMVRQIITEAEKGSFQNTTSNAPDSGMRMLPAEVPDMETPSCLPISKGRCNLIQNLVSDLKTTRLYNQTTFWFPIFRIEKRPPSKDDTVACLIAKNLYKPSVQEQEDELIRMFCYAMYRLICELCYACPYRFTNKKHKYEQDHFMPDGGMKFYLIEDVPAKDLALYYTIDTTGLFSLDLTIAQAMNAVFDIIERKHRILERKYGRTTLSMELDHVFYWSEPMGELVPPAPCCAEETWQRNTPIKSLSYDDVMIDIHEWVDPDLNLEISMILDCRGKIPFGPHCVEYEDDVHLLPGYSLEEIEEMHSQTVSTVFLGETESQSPDDVELKKSAAKTYTVGNEQSKPAGSIGVGAGDEASTDPPDCVSALLGKMIDDIVTAAGNKNTEDKFCPIAIEKSAAIDVKETGTITMPRAFDGKNSLQDQEAVLIQVRALIDEMIEKAVTTGGKEDTSHKVCPEGDTKKEVAKVGDTAGKVEKIGDDLKKPEVLTKVQAYVAQLIEDAVLIVQKDEKTKACTLQDEQVPAISSVNISGKEEVNDAIAGNVAKIIDDAVLKVQRDEKTKVRDYVQMIISKAMAIVQKGVTSKNINPNSGEMKPEDATSDDKGNSVDSVNKQEVHAQFRALVEDIADVAVDTANEKATLKKIAMNEAEQSSATRSNLANEDEVDMNKHLGELRKWVDEILDRSVDNCETLRQAPVSCNIEKHISPMEYDKAKVDLEEQLAELRTWVDGLLNQSVENAMIQIATDISCNIEDREGTASIKSPMDGQAGYPKDDEPMSTQSPPQQFEATTDTMTKGNLEPHGGAQKLMNQSKPEIFEAAQGSEGGDSHESEAIPKNEVYKTKSSEENGTDLSAQIVEKADLMKQEIFGESTQGESGTRSISDTDKGDLTPGLLSPEAMNGNVEHTSSVVSLQNQPVSTEDTSISDMSSRIPASLSTASFGNNVDSVLEHESVKLASSVQNFNTSMFGIAKQPLPPIGHSTVPQYAKSAQAVPRPPTGAPNRQNGRAAFIKRKLAGVRMTQSAVTPEIPQQKGVFSKNQLVPPIGVDMVGQPSAHIRKPYRLSALPELTPAELQKKNIQKEISKKAEKENKKITINKERADKTKREQEEYMRKKIEEKEKKQAEEAEILKQKKAAEKREKIEVVTQRQLSNKEKAEKYEREFAEKSRKIREMKEKRCNKVLSQKKAYNPIQYLKPKRGPKPSQVPTLPPIHINNGIARGQ